MGPTTKTLSVTGGTTFDELIDNYEEQARALITGGADLLLLETSQDMLNVKAGFIGIRQAFEKPTKPFPSWYQARSNRWARHWPARISNRSISHSSI